METNCYLFDIAAVILIVKDKEYFSKMYSICFSVPNAPGTSFLCWI